MTEPLRSSKLKSWHFDRAAIVYVRQSSPQQVIDHQESTARQYGLVDRAVTLGWPRAQVVVIDDDLGKSGQSVEGRPGFQRLLAEVALDRLDAREIAGRLNAAGFRPPKRTTHFTGPMVRGLLERLGLPGRERLGSRTGLSADEWRPGELARHLDISRDTLHKWRGKNWLDARRDADGHWILWADAAETARLRELHALPRTWANKLRLQELIKPKRRPMR